MYEPPYVTVNPFSSNPPRPNSPPSSGHSHSSAHSPSDSVHSRHHASRPSFPSHDPSTLSLPGSWPARLRRPTWRRRLRHLLIFSLVFIFIRVPRQIYLYLLLRLPILYFSRVSRVFEDANLSLPDIHRMAVANADQWKDGTPGALLTMWIPNDAAVSPQLLNFRHSWEGFIDSLLREWKTQNVIAALMLSAILTMLQIDAAASDPIARTTAILSLISALMSLLFGSMYIIRFGTMRKMYKAASWADEAQRGKTSILWNVWILLAIPAVWLAWSIILFVTCIMVFTWRTGATEDPVDTALSHNAARGLRIGVSTVLAAALIYFFLIVKTFRKYGDTMDKRWKEKVIGWAREGRYTQIGTYPGAWEPSSLGSRSRSRSRTSMYTGSRSDPVIVHSSRSRSPIQPTSRPQRGRRFSRSGPSREIPPVRSPPVASFNRSSIFVGISNIHGLTPFAAVKVMDLRYNSSRTYPLPNLLQGRDILLADWLQFTG
ncbi:hypothetical protein B0H13DRAFT_1609989 [Mycena leptocephala]|nr:hypothetical protein B0H13DRAFT_1609989 [Mycena leptocephala]